MSPPPNWRELGRDGAALEQLLELRAERVVDDRQERCPTAAARGDDQEPHAVRPPRVRRAGRGSCGRPGRGAGWRVHRARRTRGTPPRGGRARWSGRAIGAPAIAARNGPDVALEPARQPAVRRRRTLADAGDALERRRRAGEAQLHVALPSRQQGRRRPRARPAGPPGRSRRGRRPARPRTGRATRRRSSGRRPEARRGCRRTPAA